MLRLLPIALLLVLAACAATPTRAPEPPQAAAAEQWFRQGEFEAAALAFIEASEAPRAPRGRYLLRAAESWREEGRLEEVRTLLSRIDRSRLSPGLQTRLALLQAELALQDADASTALDRLSGAPPSGASALRWYELRARALATLDRPLEAAAARAELDTRLPDSERRANARELAALLRALDDETVRAAAKALAEDGALRPWLGATLAQRGLPLPWDGGHAIALPFEPLPADSDGYAPPRRIAVLLPQSGALAAPARAVRDGLLAAFHAETRVRPELRFYDSGEAVEQALAAFDTASAAGADLVIGPLTREAVAALFDRGRLATPTLALNRGGAVPPPPGSQSFALSPDEEAAEAAERFSRRGIRRVIAIGSNEESSQRSLEAFAQRFAQRGGEVLATAQLPESDPNYAPALEAAFAGLQAPIPPALLWSLEGAEPPTPDYDGVFLALRPTQARLLVPQLKLIGIEGLPMFATSMIQGVESDPRLDRELDGIEFTTLPWLIDSAIGVPRREHLAADLDSAQGAGARLFAFGIDAFRLAAYLGHLSAQPGATLFGATGELSLDGFGQVQRVPTWARFRSGRPQPAEGALQPDGHGS